VNKPYCIELLQAKAWTTEHVDGTIRWVRGFGAPVRLRGAAQLLLCISGEKLPSSVLLNSVLIYSTRNHPDRLEFEIGSQLLDRNNVELVWKSETVSEVIADGFASLSSVHLEIFE
jgi:hypothetical protein